MNLLKFILLSVITMGVVLAGPPKTHSASRYRDLYLNSPMTDPPEPPVEEEGPPSDLPDWVLVDLTKYVDRTEIQIMNKKDRSRVRIPSKEATEMGFTVKSVVQGRNYLKDSVVTLKKGKDTGEVRFDPKFLVLKKVAGTPARGGSPQRPSTTQNGRNTGGGAPPIPGSRNTTTNNSRNRGATNTTSRTNIPRPSSVPRVSTNANTNNTTNNATNTKSTKSSSSSGSSRRTRYIGGNK